MKVKKFIKFDNDIDDSAKLMDVVKKVPSDWKSVFNDCIPELEHIAGLLDNTTYLPRKKDIFRAFYETRVDNVKVVIIGQDPYHDYLESGIPQAMGLSFSVPSEAPIPKSLQYIYKELSREYPGITLASGNLIPWTKQGVLLLNSCLTVEPHKPGSHGSIWAGFISRVMMEISKQRTKPIFLLWGKEAQKIEQYISSPREKILKSSHPVYEARSPGSFIGNNHFMKVNEILVKDGLEPIDWVIRE